MVTMDDLFTLALRISDELAQGPVESELRFENFHGFQKANINHILARVSGSLKEVASAEIVRVDRNLGSAVHKHLRSNALVLILGRKWYFSSPLNAFALVGVGDDVSGPWVEVRMGEVLRITAGTAHGFTVEPGGILYFLSVQNPPITEEGGAEDYVPL